MLVEAWIELTYSLIEGVPISENRSDLELNLRSSAQRLIGSFKATLEAENVTSFGDSVKGRIIKTMEKELMDMATTQRSQYRWNDTVKQFRVQLHSNLEQSSQLASDT